MSDSRKEGIEIKVNTPQIIDEVSQRMGASKKDTREVLQHLADVIVEHAEAGQRVYYKPLGIFYVAESARSGRMVWKFRPSAGVRAKVDC